MKPKLINAHDTPPKIGEEVGFYYQGSWYIGYLLNNDMSLNPRKWEWYAYNWGVINEIVHWWFELPEYPE